MLHHVHWHVSLTGSQAKRRQKLTTLSKTPKLSDVAEQLPLLEEGAVKPDLLRSSPHSKLTSTNSGSVRVQATAV